MNILLIGCGNLGRLFLRRWAEDKTFQEIWVVQPSIKEECHFKAHSHIHFVRDPLYLPKAFIPTVVVIAIKPQQISDIMEAYSIYTSSIFISLAAGVSIANLKKYLGENAIIARLMPNIAIRVHESLNLAFIPNKAALTALESLCKGSGYFIPVNKEQDLDKLTVISASGPAYFYLLMEGLIKTAIDECGIDEKTAHNIVKQTFIGSALLIKDHAESCPKTLRHQITSKKGITEAVIESLEAPLFLALKRAIIQGIKRTGELLK